MGGETGASIGVGGATVVGASVIGVSVTVGCVAGASATGLSLVDAPVGADTETTGSDAVSRSVATVGAVAALVV